MSVSTIISTKLKGTENYAVWALRMTAYLRRQGFISVTETDDVSNETNDYALADIELCLEDGPLLRIQHIKRAPLLWVTLRNLYTPKDLSADFLVIKEFFNCKLSNFDTMEDFLNTSRRLLDSMAQRGIGLPKKVIFTQYLNNLTNNYENIKSKIMQTLSKNFDGYSLDEMFSNLLDEANRLQSKADISQTALVAFKSKPGKKFKGKNSYKVTKGMLCRHCHRTNHTTSDCFELFPEKIPKKFKGSGLHSKLELWTRHTSDGVKNVKDNKVLTPKLINLDGMHVDPTIESIL
ncbi:hypothetical protein OnM2_064073 [Erysiphe neolycopersici]|uniref:DUF4219 domain-containing protein n=1 Tax=Erysiphe neolycopersici TaxID=212602 RepID=A0A420HND4_9PEZI|nr:hypothetical protein OnM2_064073 [Erysiphe neolycopersici]